MNSASSCVVLLLAMALYGCAPAAEEPGAEPPEKAQVAKGTVVKAGPEGYAPAKLEPIEKVELGARGELRVNGKPFIPIRAGAQPERLFRELRGLGINTFHRNFAGKPPAREYCDKAWEVNAYAIPLWGSDAECQPAKGHPALLAWTHTDEPDLGMHIGKPQMTVEEILARYKEMKQGDATRPMWLTFTAAFMTDGPWARRMDVPAALDYYRKAVAGGDIICFDIYPVYGWNRDDKLDWVASGVAQLRELAGGRPVAAIMESSKGTENIAYEKQKDVTPEMTRFETWSALIRGSRVIGYFFHQWKPRMTTYNPTPEMKAELRRLNFQVTRLTAPLCAEPSKRKITMSLKTDAGEDLPCNLLATEHEGSLWIFAQNADMGRRGGRGTFRVAGLQSGAKVVVVDELVEYEREKVGLTGRQRAIVRGPRVLRAADGLFTDTFGKLEEHIYRIPLAP